MKTKDRILVKGLTGIGVVTILSYVIFTPALIFADPSVGKAFALGVPPMVLISLSWIIGYWYTMDKSFRACSTLTIGMMPVRLIVYCAWIMFVQRYIVEVSILAMVLSSIAHWIMFMVAEVMTLQAFLSMQGEEKRQRAISAVQSEER